MEWCERHTYCTSQSFVIEKTVIIVSARFWPKHTCGCGVACQMGHILSESAEYGVII